MTNYNIEVKAEYLPGRVREHDEMGCSLWAESPLSGEKILFFKYKEDGELIMNFIDRIKEYIESKIFIDDLRKEIIFDYVKYADKKELEDNYETIKRKLDGLTFSVNVEIDEKTKC